MTLDANGALRSPNPQEAYLEGLALSDGTGQRMLRVAFRPERPVNRRFALVLEGLEHLRCMDFREGNIVLSVEIVRHRKPDAAALHALFDTGAKASTPWIDRFARDVAVGKLTFVRISPSYGCELIALCKEVYTEEERGAR
jgi:hypothetical protein